jgi:KDO2-lipid IV(A) lauroyltransferase
MSRQELIDEVEIEGMEILEEALQRSGKGAMLVTGHYGNWELFGAAFVARGKPTTFLVKEQSNPLASRLQNRLREMGGIEIVKQGPLVARGVLKALRRGHMVGILPDQDARRHGVFVDFLGRPASTFKGPAFFAWKENVPIVQGYIRRLPDGRHLACAERAIWPDPQAPEDAEVQRMTQLFTSDLEKWVRAYPENYYWVHRRWKTQPEEAEPYQGPDPHRRDQSG